MPYLTPKQIARRTKSVVARECGIPYTKINYKTLFIGNKNANYWGILSTLFTIQQRFGLKVPQPEYKNYQTVGDLIHAAQKQYQKNPHER